MNKPPTYTDIHFICSVCHKNNEGANAWLKGGEYWCEECWNFDAREGVCVAARLNLLEYKQKEYANQFEEYDKQIEELQIAVRALEAQSGSKKKKHKHREEAE